MAPLFSTDLATALMGVRASHGHTHPTAAAPRPKAVAHRDPYRAHRIFLLIRDAGCSEPRRRKVKAERKSVSSGRDDRMPPRRLTHAVKLPQADHEPGGRSYTNWSATGAS